MVITPLNFKFLSSLPYNEKIKFYCSIFKIGSIEQLVSYFTAGIAVVVLPITFLILRGLDELVPGVKDTNLSSIVSFFLIY